MRIKWTRKRERQHQCKNIKVRKCMCCDLCDGCTYFLKPFPPRGKRREEKGGSRRVHATCLQVEICTATCPDYRCRIPAFRYSKCYLLFISHIFLQLGVIMTFFFFLRRDKTRHMVVYCCCSPVRFQSYSSLKMDLPVVNCISTSAC